VANATRDANAQPYSGRIAVNPEQSRASSLRAADDEITIAWRWSG
jgi:hypothetical protein